MEWQIEMRRIATGWLFGDLEGARLPNAVVLPMENPDLHDHDAFVSRLANVRQYRTVAIGTYQGQSIGVLNPKFGSPAVAMTVEAAAAMGAKVIVGVGFCGGLQHRIRCGDLVVAHACVRDDGTTARYVGEGYPAAADHGLVVELESRARAKRPTHTGVIWSTDAILMETSEKIRHWSSHGCLGVDMESGTLFTVGRLFNVRTCSVLVASDNPLSGSETVLDALRAGIVDAIDLGFGLAANHEPLVDAGPVL